MNIYNKTYLAILLIFSSLFFLLNLSSCDSNEPENIKSPRDYTWSVDKIYNPGAQQTLMRSIWGSAEDDIYICGHTSGSGAFLWHFNGNKWEPIDLISIVGSVGSLNKVHGTAADNVWVVGSYRKNNEELAYVAHYNGITWSKIDLEIKSKIKSVFVSDYNDVTVCGSNGYVAHYNKSRANWNIFNVNLNDEFQFIDIVAKESTKYLIGIDSQDNGISFKYYFYELQKETFQIVDTFSTNLNNQDHKFGSWLKIGNDKKLYSHGLGGVFELSNKVWSKIYNSIESQTAFGEYGSNNIIIGDQYHGILRHFNGVNWQILEAVNLENIWWTGVWMNRESCVIIGQILNENPQTTVILRGQ